MENTEVNIGLLIEEIEVNCLQILRNFRNLITAAEQELADWETWATYICDTPIALITLLTHDRLCLNPDSEYRC